MLHRTGRGTRRVLGSRLTLAVAAAATGMGVASGVAYAAAPGDTGTIEGCYSKLTGVLRVIDVDSETAKKKCLGGVETPLTWNAQGQAGPIGPEGPAGPEGPPGKTAGLDVYVKIGDGIVLCDQGDVATGGAATGDSAVISSTPIFNGDFENPTGWAAGTEGDDTASVTVICARQPKS